MREESRGSDGGGGGGAIPRWISDVGEEQCSLRFIGRLLIPFTLFCSSISMAVTESSSVEVDDTVEAEDDTDDLPGVFGADPMSYSVT